MSQERSRRDAFTLIEVLLVMVILVILASFAVSMYSNTQKKALVSQARAQIGLFKTPLDEYNLDIGQYPAGLDGLVQQPADAPPGKWSRPYMETIPADPWGNQYQYARPGKSHPDSYDLWTTDPDGNQIINQ